MGSLGVGVVGCGNVATTYLRNAALFPGVELRACADLAPAAAEAQGRRFGVEAVTVDALLAAPEVDIVLNLTVPAAHFDVTMAALEAGKHVYTEKPPAVTAALGRRLVEAADARGLALASAPDTFMGAAGRRARALVDGGAIGRPVAGTAFMMGHGMEHWHPAPQFYYQPGGGPVLDMGPYYLTTLVNLLGPVSRVAAMSAVGSPERLITAEGPNRGTSFRVGTPTTVMATLGFAGGALVAVGMSWDVWRHGIAPIELHGTEGSVRVPDPDTYGGAVELSHRGAEWRAFPSEGAPFGAANWPFDAPRVANYRMLGVAEMARAIRAGRPARTSAALALHVLEVLEATLTSGETGRPVTLPEPPAAVRPEPLPEDEARSLRA
jgi:predicted dehydrogenase